MVVWRIYPDTYGKFWGHCTPYGCRNVPLVEKCHRNTWRWSGWNVMCFPFWNNFSRTEYADKLAQFDSRKGTNHAIQTSTEYVRNVPVVDQAFSAGFTDTQRWPVILYEMGQEQSKPMAPELGVVLLTVVMENHPFSSVMFSHKHLHLYRGISQLSMCNYPSISPWNVPSISPSNLHQIPIKTY